MTAILTIIELIGAYDAEEIYSPFISDLSSRATDMYDFIDGSVFQSYQIGIQAIAQQYHVDPDEIPVNQEVVESIRRAAITYVANHRFEIQQKMLLAVTQAIREDWTEEELRDQLANYVSEFGWKNDVILRTELHRAGNQGRIDAMNYLGITRSRIYTAEDDRVCDTEFEVQLLGLIEGCKDFWTGRLKDTAYLTDFVAEILPFHPRCRCYSMPVGQPSIAS